MAVSLESNQATGDIRFSPTLALAWVSGFLPLESGPIWIPASGAHYGISALGVGGLASLQFLVSAVTSMLLAPRIARVDPRRAIFIGLVIVLSCALLTLFPLPFPIFAALRLCEGVGAGLCISTGGMLASRTRSPTRTFSFLQLCQILGTVTIFTVSASLLAKYGFAAIYSVIAFVTIASLIALQGGPAWSAAPTRPGGGIVGDLGRNLIAACFGIALLFCMFVAVVANAGAIGAQNGLSLSQVGIALAISTVGSAVGSLLIGVLGDRSNGWWLLAAGGVGVSVGGGLLAFAANDVSSFATALIVMTFSIYIALPSIFATVGRLQDRQPFAAAAAQAAQMLGLSLGPVAGAAIVTMWAPALGITAGAGIAAAIAIAARIRFLEQSTAITAAYPKPTTETQIKL